MCVALGHELTIENMIEELIEEPDVSIEYMYGLYSELYTLYSLLESNSEIYPHTASNFRCIASTFVKGKVLTVNFDSIALFDDEVISENEIEYLKEIIDVMDMTFEGVYDEKSRKYDI